MALHYQTEYRLGSRGRICRSYTGFQAFVAICLDLVFGLLFEFVATVLALAARLVVVTLRLFVRVLKVNWKILVAAMTLIVYILTLPFALLHRAVDPAPIAGPRPIRPNRDRPQRRASSRAGPSAARSEDIHQVVASALIRVWLTKRLGRVVEHAACGHATGERRSTWRRSRPWAPAAAPARSGRAAGGRRVCSRGRRRC